jgi:hypothetical protein
MAWTYFTDWLDEDAILTKDQRNELLDALQERLAGAGVAYEFGPDQGDIADSPLRTAKVQIHNTGPDTLSILRLDQVIDLIAAKYAESDTSMNPWSAFNLWTAAADEFSLTYSDWAAIVSGVGRGRDDHRYWNIVRRAVQFLSVRYCLLVPTGGHTKSKDGFAPTASGWAAAEADYLASTEQTDVVGVTGAVISSSEPGGTTFAVEGRRTVATIDVPATAPFADYEAWVFRSVDDVSGGGFIQFQAAEINWKLGSNVFSETPAGTGPESTYYKLVIGSGLSDTGATLAFECYHTAYFGAGLGAFSIAHSGNWKVNRCGMGSSVVYIRPTWTLP